jgi:hypothetical protein
MMSLFPLLVLFTSAANATSIDSALETADQYADAKAAKADLRRAASQISTWFEANMEKYQGCPWLETGTIKFYQSCETENRVSLNEVHDWWSQPNAMIKQGTPDNIRKLAQFTRTTGQIFDECATNGPKPLEGVRNWRGTVQTVQNKTPVDPFHWPTSVAYDYGPGSGNTCKLLFQPALGDDDVLTVTAGNHNQVVFFHPGTNRWFLRAPEEQTNDFTYRKETNYTTMLVDDPQLMAQVRSAGKATGNWNEPPLADNAPQNDPMRGDMSSVYDTDSPCGALVMCFHEALMMPSLAERFGSQLKSAVGTAQNAYDNGRHQACVQMGNKFGALFSLAGGPMQLAGGLSTDQSASSGWPESCPW